MGENRNALNAELKNQRIAKLEFDPEKKHPEIQYLLYRNGVGTFPKRNLQAITGKAKNGKTIILSIFAAAMLGDTSFKFESGMSDDEKVLYIDTEQDESNVAKVWDRINMMLGWDPNKKNARFRVFLLRTISPNERLEYIRDIIEAVKPAAVFIDGIADLIYNINDIEKSNEAVNRLMQLSEEFNCAICCTIHTNESEYNDKMRGHLGSGLTQKVTDVFLGRKKGSNSFVISHPTCRNGEIGKIPFFNNIVKDTVMPVFHESYQMEKDREKKEKKDSEKNENVYKIATEICKPGVKYQYGELRGIYMQHTKKSSSTFDRFRDKCVACEFLKRYEGEGNTVFYELIEQSKDKNKDKDIDDST